MVIKNLNLGWEIVSLHALNILSDNKCTNFNHCKDSCFQKHSILWGIVYQHSHFTMDMLHSCSLSRSSDSPRSPSGSNHVKKLDPGKKNLNICAILKTDSDINHLCSVFFHCAVIPRSRKASLWGKGPCNFISRYAWLLVSQWWREEWTERWRVVGVPGGFRARRPRSTAEQK